MFRNSIRNLKLAAMLTLVFCALAASTPARATSPTTISACGTISTAGNFVLTKNLSGVGDCLTLTASNINIDLKGHTISGNGTGSGITGNNIVNIVINDGSIQGFTTGIRLTLSNSTNTGNHTIQNMNVSSNAGDGILIDGCCDTYSNIIASNNGGDGLDTGGCCSTVNNVVTNSNSGDGMDLISCCYVVENSISSLNSGDGIFADDCCSAVYDTVASHNKGDGMDLEGCCSTVVNDASNGNKGDGVFFNGCCGDNRGNNIAVNSKANKNGGNGFSFTNLRNSIANVIANKNTDHGVFMTCPATEVGIAAKGNGSSNLDEDTSGGVCTDLNNKAP
jgi:hypothetical protein